GRELENRVALRKEGIVNPKDEAYAAHAARPLSEHLDAWKGATKAKGSTEKHVELFTRRAARVIAMIKGAALADIDPPRNVKHADLPILERAIDEGVKGATLADLTADRAQKALAVLRDEGRSLATCNHHRAASRRSPRGATTAIAHERMRCEE